MNKFCSKCNKDYDESIKFCPDCGSNLEVKSITGNESQMPSNVPQTSPLLTKVSSIDQPPVVMNTQNATYHPSMEKFGFISMIILSLITFGIYSIYWTNKFQKAVNSFVGRNVAATGWKLLFYLFITLGIYGVYLYYEDIVALNEAKDQRNMPGSRRSISACIILLLFGLGIIPWYWMISDANEIIDYENLNRGH